MTTSKQILFRADEKTMKALDRAWKKDGYESRNDWFNDTATKYAARKNKRPAPKKKVEAPTTDAQA